MPLNYANSELALDYSARIAAARQQRFLQAQMEHEYRQKQEQAEQAEQQRKIQAERQKLDAQAERQRHEQVALQKQQAALQNQRAALQKQQQQAQQKAREQVKKVPSAQQSQGGGQKAIHVYGAEWCGFTRRQNKEIEEALANDPNSSDKHVYFNCAEDKSTEVCQKLQAFPLTVVHEVGKAYTLEELTAIKQPGYRPGPAVVAELNAS